MHSYIHTYILGYLTFKDMNFMTVSKTMKSMKVLSYMVCNCVWKLHCTAVQISWHIYGLSDRYKTFDCQTYTKAE